MFQINEVVEYNQALYRILILLPDHLIWIALEDKSAFPRLMSQSELSTAIDEEILFRRQDPYVELAFQTPEEGSTARVKRDKNYQLIKPLLDSPECYLPKSRSAIINKIIAEQGSTKQTLYRLARRYWQRGQTPNALLPDYKNSGAKGKKRTGTAKKLGRPRKDMPGMGVIIDDFIERLFRIAIDKYLLTDKGYSFPYAHRRFKTIYENHFPDTPEEEMPTNWQMLHFYKREYQQAEKIQARVSRIAFNKDVRPIISTANTQVLGPGSRYEIDATIADIYLVSDSDRGNIVGRPVVYMVKDVFSRMVAGFYVGFENASYVAAMQSLAMAMTDKVELCRQYGFEIDSEDWPAVGLPDAILADRGEMLGYQIESLENNFSVRIENTPPYRGEAKGIVERSFKALHADYSAFAPGVVTGTKIKKRGDKDYRLDARLTIREFKEILLSSILYHNQFAVLEKYDRDIDMPTDLPLVPKELWNWGLQHRTGRLRAASYDALRVSLLPRIKATLSDLGACAFGVYYTSEELIKLGWLHRSPETVRPEKIDAAYDPGSADHIYLFPEKNSTKYWICKLADRSREFVGSSFWDVWQLQAQQKQTMAKSKVVSEQKKRHHEEFVVDKIKQAVKMAADTGSLSNAERIAAINDNKRKEKAVERRENAYRPEKTTRDREADVVHLAEPEEPDYSYPDHIDELFGEDDEL
ncbi:DDE-type integrase/transposase/recombinase [Thalassomonas viridans]|uniref:DDE-type integrase/transposase/recombinase n=1 Tax=Thalassomonas viridans TaxID=137584 RepID=A0AAE9Z2H7_9GAMM|nr:DDE-type integrase/transposase/recombinase [Thalassomonas viridans]WDE05425.1 DDE-type integrase/transposase/recombinase [Thalassomonas viridans]